MDTRITLRRLEIFCLVVQTGSVTRVAEQLVVAQPAISSQLRSLERWLGAKVLVRAGNRLVLTEEGQRAYEWAEELLARTRELRRELDGLSEPNGGSLSITASVAVGIYLLAPALTELRAQRPAADITLNIVEPEHAFRSVELGDADAGIISWDQRDAPPHLQSELLYKEDIVLCAAPDGPPDADEISIQDLRQLPFVGVPRNVAFHRILTGQLRHVLDDDLVAHIRLGHPVSIKRAVIDHRWVTLLPRYVVERELAAGELRTVRLSDARLTEAVSLFSRKEKSLSAFQLSALAAIEVYLAERLALREDAARVESTLLAEARIGHEP